MYTNILHATDLAEDHFKMCQQAVEIAKRFKANLYLLHVIETPRTLQIAQGLGFAEIENPTQIKQDAMAVMGVLGEALKVPVSQQFIEVGSIRQHVLNKMKELDCQLLIMGYHMSHNMPAYLESSAHTIANQANYDILTLSNR